MFIITGCAVAQHCYNGNVSFLWEKMETLTHVKSKPLKRLAHNLSGLITSTRGVFVPNLVKIRSRGTSGQHGEIPFCVTFYFFPGTNVEKRLDRFWRLMVQNTRNRGYEMKNWNLTTIYPQTLKIWPKWWNMELQVYQKALNQSRWNFDTMLGT